MNNTALRAELLSASGTCSATNGAECRPQSTTSHKESVTYGDHPYDITHMVFANKQHKKFYYEKLEQARYQDCYHKALIYILGISENTRNHFCQIYDIKSGLIKIECLHQGWQTSSSVKIIRLAFNLYTDGMPGVDDYKRKDEQTSECREYSVSEIFCCSYAMYFWEGIKLRYPEYCWKQRTVEEILAEMEEKSA